jgi:molecular chaperone GrpE (heat shock protein)/DNA-binding Xre family transcriptional regulator
MTLPDSHHKEQSVDRTHSLQQLMQRVGLSTFKSLSQASGLSEKQLRHVRRGSLTQMRLETLLKLSQALQLSLPKLLEEMEGESLVDSHWSLVGKETKARSQKSEDAGHQRTNDKEPVANDYTDLRQEYDRLQGQLTQQREALLQEFQQSSLQILESLLLQLPTAAYAAQQNPQAPAVKLLPLLKPLDRLLQEWGIEAIGVVGAEIPYNPQWHQLMDGVAEPGDSASADSPVRVKVRYIGYRQGDKLLYRAKVSPLPKA